MNDQKLLVALNAIVDAINAVSPSDKVEPARKAVEALQPNPEFPFGQGGANA